MRKSGDPYITHPLAVATILAELGMDATTLVAALLHDTVEDTDATRSTSIREELRRRGRRARRRRHQARQGRVRTASGRGRDRPQDGRRDGARPAVLSSSSPTGCTTCARCATSRRRSRSAVAARRSRSTRRWPTGSAWTRVQVGARGPRVHARCYPKRYDEIVRLVADRAAASATHTWHEVVEQRARRTCEQAKIQRDGHRPAEALLLDLPEDDRARPRVRRHLRPRRRPHRSSTTVRDCYAALGVDPRALERRSRAASRTTSRCPSSTCTSRCTRR